MERLDRINQSTASSTTLELNRDTEDISSTSHVRKKTRVKKRVSLKRINQKIKSRYLLLTVGIMSSVVLLASIVFTYTNMVRLNSDIIVNKTNYKNLLLEKNNLEYEIKPYIDRERIEKLASEQLGMVYPSSENIVEINSEEDIKTEENKGIPGVSKDKVNGNKIFNKQFFDKIVNSIFK